MSLTVSLFAYGNPQKRERTSECCVICKIFPHMGLSEALPCFLLLFYPPKKVYHHHFFRFPGGPPTQKLYPKFDQKRGQKKGSFLITFLSTFLSLFGPFFDGF